MEIFDIYKYGLENVNIKNKNNSIEVEIISENGFNNTIYFVENNEKIPVSEFKHDIINMEVLYIKENVFGKVEIFLSQDLDENDGKDDIFKAIKGFEEVIKKKVDLDDSYSFNSNIINEYKYINRKNEVVTIPERLKLNVKKYFEQNNKSIEDYPKNTYINCNITCNKLWIYPKIKKYGIWWSVNNIQINKKAKKNKNFISNFEQLNKLELEYNLKLIIEKFVKTNIDILIDKEFKKKFLLYHPDSCKRNINYNGRKINGLGRYMEEKTPLIKDEDITKCANQLYSVLGKKGILNDNI